MKTDTTINGRTPEEIKKGIEYCISEDVLSCDECPYAGKPCDGMQMFKDVLALIQQLERERDAAVERCVTAYDVGSGYYHEIQQLESAQPKWISVEERLPTELGEVMVCVYGRVTIAWYGGNGGFETGSGVIFWAGDGIVTHWMPLPEPPKEYENGT